jgi:hypothetical protein
MTYINRDPFARQELHREVVKPEPSQFSPSVPTCSWCGQTRKNGSLFAYSTESDGGRRSTHRGLFCCKSCHDSYHS